MIEKKKTYKLDIRSHVLNKHTKISLTEKKTTVKFNFKIIMTET